MNVSTINMSWRPAKRELITEASTLWGPRSNVPSQMVVNSHRTGKDILFFLDEVVHVANEMFFRFRSHVTDVTIVVFND